MSDQKFTLLTQEGLQKLKDELEYLKGDKRKEVAERLKEAISYGDLSENSEYEEAKNEQAFVESRILELDEKIKYAKVIVDKDSDGVTVQLGSKILIKNLTAKNAVEESYTIVGSTESDPLAQKISNESPVGLALLGKEAGDIVKVNAPDGLMEYELLSVE